MNAIEHLHKIAQEGVVLPEVGDYIRTKRGLIGKIININTFREPCMKYGIEASYLDDIWFIGDDDIKLVKDKLTDLIEVGDYVNGFKVLEILSHSNSQLIFVAYNYNVHKYTKILDNDEIKSIVTKEQFESMEYRIEE